MDKNFKMLEKQKKSTKISQFFLNIQEINCKDWLRDVKRGFNSRQRQIFYSSNPYIALQVLDLIKSVLEASSTEI